MLWLLLLLGCASVPRFPGPLGPVGRAARSPAPLVEREAEPVDEPSFAALAESRGPERSAFGDQVAASAVYYLSTRPRGYRADCSGYVCAVYARAGLPLDGNTASLWEQARAVGAVHRRKIPRIGDLAFFDNTYDRNGDGRWNDELSHVAVVVDVEPDGTIVLAHYGASKGRTRLRMNLRQPDVHTTPEGRVLNDHLRIQKPSDPSRAVYLSGQLWRAFATVRPEDFDAWVSP